MAVVSVTMKDLAKKEIREHGMGAGVHGTLVELCKILQVYHPFLSSATVSEQEQPQKVGAVGVDLHVFMPCAQKCCRG